MTHWHLNLGARILSSLLIFHACNDFVKPRKRYIEFDMTRMMVLRCWLVGQFIFDNRKHFAHGEENATSEFVLIIQ